MPSNTSLGPIILLVGLGLVALGLVVWSGALSWFGRLPGDIRVERPGVSVFAPITSMIVVSVVLSAMVGLFRWFGRP
ncbi:DUF2905 domain-containing protein [Paludisphaera mucosa]|uniref:DUF2905 domain-containing protein n=1 Tax=Paludisphaera mucosa TaxID=3030827 RepID=A0ABT6FDW9_9BACT|nr:DUF2905 domain-containing protein [Paludisphaera mucosa]MDG3005696.1 DUF2905 domain-containing protein [Paludisphaera mucosa]